MGEGRFEDAIPIYRSLVGAVPGNPGLILNLALAEHMAGHHRESIPKFETVLRMQPGALPALISLGAAHLALNEPKLAVSPLERAAAADPSNADVRGMLAGAVFDAGRFESAAAQYQKLTELSPLDPRAWYGLGRSYESAANAAFEKLQKLDAQSAYVSALVADTRLARRQFRSAFFFYTEALKKKPGLMGANSGLAEVYRQTGHEDWASAVAERENGRKRPVTASLPESLYWQVKDNNVRAIEAFGHLEQLPVSVELHQVRASIARDHDQNLEAVKEWRAALELAPGNPQLREELAEALFLAKDYSGALAESADLLKLDKRAAELNFIAGDSALRLEDPEKAVPFLNAALAADPAMLAAHASLGLALIRLNKAAQAIPHLEKALGTDDDGTLHFQYARALQEAGDAAKAAQAMAKYQQLVQRNDRARQEASREAQIGPPQ